MIANQTSLQQRPNDVKLKFTIKGYGMASEHKYNTHPHVSYKRQQNEKCKTIHSRKLTAWCHRLPLIVTFYIYIVT